MQNAVDIPVSIKCRLGVDKEDSYEFLYNFIKTVEGSGITTFIIHARNAILAGLSPRQNRHIPPLKYDYVYRLKKDFPHLNIIINGGIKSMEESVNHLQHVDGVMIGRAAYEKLDQGHDLSRMMKHLFGLSRGDKFAKTFRIKILEVIKNNDIKSFRQDLEDLLFY
jgi:tRNA-dihydrouridine synthase A